MKGKDIATMINLVLLVMTVVAFVVGNILFLITLHMIYLNWMTNTLICLMVAHILLWIWNINHPD